MSLLIVAGEDRVWAARLTEKVNGVKVPFNLTGASVLASFDHRTSGRKIILRSAAFTLSSADAATDRLTLADHGLVDGQEISFSSTTGGLPTGLALATPYYVRDSDRNSFKLAGSVGGAAIDLTTAGTGVHTIAGTDSGGTYGLTVLGTAELGRLQHKLNDLQTSFLLVGESLSYRVSPTVSGATRKGDALKKLTVRQ